MCIDWGHYVIYLQNMKFVQSILWPGEAYTNAAHTDRAKIMIPYSDEIMNHDYIDSMACMPNEPKIGQDAHYIGNWRSLTLLNCDYKIFSKLLATRMNMVLPRLIHATQFDFMKGRNIADNILQLTNILQECCDKEIEAVLISVDFKKAFDTMEWSAIKKNTCVFWIWSFYGINQNTVCG